MSSISANSSADITEFCEGLGIDLMAAQTDAALQNISHINDAMERILINDETKKNYLQSATNVTKLYKAILPDPNAHEFTKNLPTYQYHRTENQAFNTTR